ncbi:MAG: site-specific integrase [Oscillospiraceae bacterium]
MADKLPSGNYRTRVTYTDELGKRKSESFTAESPEEANYMAAEFKFKHKRETRAENITLDKAFDRYIDSRKDIVSPATVRSYKQIKRTLFQTLMQTPVRKLTQPKLQVAVNSESSHLSPKTVINAYHIVLSVMKYCGCNTNYNIKLPTKVPSGMLIPTPTQAQELIKKIAGTDMEIPVLLSVCFGMRRGEVCALQWKDYDKENGTITVSHAKAIDEFGIYHDKSTKNSTRRVLTVPKILIDRLIVGAPDEYIVKLAPNVVTKGFRKLRDELGLPGIRFHDLRHFNASIMSRLNIPDKYQQERGGWKTKEVLNRVYQHTFNDKRIEVDQTINTYLDELLK